MKKYLLEVYGMIIGGRGCTVVLDETNLGAQKGIRKGPQMPRSMSRKRGAVPKRAPATTRSNTRPWMDVGS